MASSIVEALSEVGATDGSENQNKIRKKLKLDGLAAREESGLR